MLEHPFQAMESGFALHEIIYDHAGAPVDYRFLRVNAAFEQLTGLRAAEIIGHCASEVLAGIESARGEMYGHIAEMGEPVHFETYWTPLRRHFEITAFCPQPGQFAVLLQDISARKRVEQAEREQGELAEALRDTAILLNGTLQLEQVIERILDNVGRVVPHDAANISLIENGEIRFVGSHGYGDASGSFFSAHKHYPISHFYSMQSILETGNPLTITDTLKSENWVILAEAAWVRSHVAAPIRARQKMIGFLSLDSAQPGFFDETAAGRLDAFAAQAAVALENARLLDEAHRRAAQLESLNRAAIRIQQLRDPLEIFRAACDELQGLGTFAQVYERVPSGLRHIYTAMSTARRREYHQLFGKQTDTIVIPTAMLGDAMAQLEQGEYITRGPLPSFTTEVATPRTIAIIQWMMDAMPNGKALLAPLTRQSQMMGVIAILGDDVRASDADAVALFARQVSAALENARLWNETRQRLSELDAINRISTVLRQATTQAEMTARVLDETLSVLHAHDGQIAFLTPNKRELIVHAARGWFVDTPRRAPVKDGIAGMVLALNQPYCTRDFFSDAATSELARQKVPNGFGGALVPVRNMREPIGVLAIAIESPREFGTGELALLTTIAEIAGNAFARAASFGQTEQRIQQLAALRAIDTAINASTDLRVTLDILLTHTLAQLNMDAGAVLSFEPASQTLLFAAERGFRTNALQHTQLALGRGYAGTAARDRRVIVVPDLNAAIDGLGHAPLLPYEDFKSYVAVPLLAKGTLQGVLELFSRAPFQSDSEWLDFCSAIAAQAALTIDNAKLVSNLERTNQDLKLAYDSTIEGWSRALDLRDHETEGHTRRVTEQTLRLARTLGMSEAELIDLKRGALLHDIGKMGIPDSVLLKPGKLSLEEWKIMRRHPQLAYEMLAPIPYLNRALEIPYCHHERWDGSGYPRGLKGEEIPFAARIFAVVDTWDALRSDRPYRKGWMEIQVRAYLQDEAGKSFDPRVVRAFLEMI